MVCAIILTFDRHTNYVLETNINQLLQPTMKTPSKNGAKVLPFHHDIVYLDYVKPINTYV